MTDTQRAQIPILRRQGHGYKRISQALDLPLNTVKSFCRRNESQPVDTDAAHCLFCGNGSIRPPAGKRSDFVPTNAGASGGTPIRSGCGAEPSTNMNVPVATSPLQPMATAIGSSVHTTATSAVVLGGLNAGNGSQERQSVPMDDEPCQKTAPFRYDQQGSVRGI